MKDREVRGQDMSTVPCTWQILQRCVHIRRQDVAHLPSRADDPSRLSLNLNHLDFVTDHRDHDGHHHALDDHLSEASNHRVEKSESEIGYD